MVKDIYFVDIRHTMSYASFMQDVIFDCDPQKNTKLKEGRGVSFEEIICMIEDGKVLDIIENNNSNKYPHQKMYVIDIDGYVYLVPFIQDKNRIFLKTIFPSRKATKQYLLGDGL